MVNYRPPRITRKSYRPRASDRTTVDNVQPRSLSCFLIRKRRHENRMDLRRAKTQEPLNMTWAGKQSEQPRSFQSPETCLLLTFPFIGRANRPCKVLELDFVDLRTLLANVCPFLGCGVKGAGPLRLMYRRWYTTSK